MSDFVIKDGTGSGYRASVDSDHRLHTAATTRTRSSAATETGQAFALSLPDYYITVPGHEFGVIYFHNEDPGNDYHVNSAFGRES